MPDEQTTNETPAPTVGGELAREAESLLRAEIRKFQLEALAQKDRALVLAGELQTVRAQVESAEERAEGAELELADAKEALARLDARRVELEREVEGYRRGQHAGVPAASLVLPGLNIGDDEDDEDTEASGVPPVEPKLDPEELERRLVACADAINRDEQVSTEDLKEFIDACKFRKLEGSFVDAYARATELLAMVSSGT